MLEIGKMSQLKIRYTTIAMTTLQELVVHSSMQHHPIGGERGCDGVGFILFLFLFWGACSKCTLGGQTGMNRLPCSSPQYPSVDPKDADLLAMSKHASLCHHR